MDLILTELRSIWRVKSEVVQEPDEVDDCYMVSSKYIVSKFDERVEVSTL